MFPGYRYLPAFNLFLVVGNFGKFMIHQDEKQHLLANEEDTVDKAFLTGIKNHSNTMLCRRLQITCS